MIGDGWVAYEMTLDCLLQCIFRGKEGGKKGVQGVSQYRGDVVII